MATTQKVPLTRRALIARINRRLKHDDQALRCCRSNSRWWRELGDFYIVDINRNIINDVSVDPTEFGRELGVLHPFEEVGA